MERVGSGQRLGQRELQEDALAVVRPTDADAESDVLLLLSDGMGGHAGGEVASALAIETFSRHFTAVSENMRPRGRLTEALEAANAAIGARIADAPELGGMGCTFIGALAAQGRLIWVSVGDSVLYLLRNGRLQRLNADHSLMGELSQMVERGEITRAEAENHPQRNALRSALTGGDIAMIDVNALALEPGDTVVVASDGIETIAPDEIAEIVQARRREGAQAIADRLLDAVERRAQPRQDNTTVLVLQQTGTTSSGGFFPVAGGGGRRPLGALPLAGGAVGAVALGFLAFALLHDPAPAPAPAGPATEPSARPISGGGQNDESLGTGAPADTDPSTPIGPSETDATDPPAIPEADTPGAVEPPAIPEADIPGATDDATDTDTAPDPAAPDADDTDPATDTEPESP